MPLDVPDAEKLRVSLSLRITKSEGEGLDALCSEHGMSQSRMVRRLIRTASGLPVAPDPASVEAIKSASEELRRIGVNVNQAVRAMHEGRASFTEDLAEGLALVADMIAGMQETHSILLRTARENARSRLRESQD